MDPEISSILSKMSLAWTLVKTCDDFQNLCDRQIQRLNEMEEKGFDYRDYCEYWNIIIDMITAEVRLGIISEKQGNTQLRRMIYRLKAHIRNKVEQEK